ncbi:MarR family transcriptional regulator [Anaerovorax odorimutans]|uniref:MarR family transcriptional regulator n=1 Tax=Anaerovorax odorimutans TaxID=109327 RepID=A0ABT1RN28_9FIRM|nr:MarR family transcriptional regulator [Anaerovorax odorimutans]MCQ4636326.1 MarR family transcriptional regulator [Anaerovorax odorimutans]
MNGKIYSEIGRLMMSYGKYFRTYMKKALSPAGLNMAGAMVLMLLYEKDGRSQDQLLEGVHYDKSVMTRTMQSLEKNAFLMRRKNPDDGRSWIFVLTQKGRDVKPQVLTALHEWCAIAFADISQEDIETLLRLMIRLQTNIKEL